MNWGCFFRRRCAIDGQHDDHELHRLMRRVADLETEVARLKQYDIQQELTKIMADTASILAKLTAQKGTLATVASAVDVLKEGQTSIKDEIADLKRQIAEGQTADFTAIEAAVDDQGTIIDGLVPAVGANP